MAEIEERSRLKVCVRYWITEAQRLQVRELAQDRQLSESDIYRAALRFYLKAQAELAEIAA